MSAKPVAIVTGGAQGLGRAFTEALLENGYKVCIADINEETGKATTQELATKFGSTEVSFVQCDVTKESDYAKTFEETLKVFEKVDVLVNNAGIIAEKDFEKTMLINVNGVILGCQAAFKYMGTDNGGNGGTVVNTASILGLIPFDVLPYYTASKHAVVGLTRSFGTSLFFDKCGLTFNAICPAYVNTPMLDIIDDKEHFLQRDDVMEAPFVAQAIIKLLEDKPNGATLAVTKADGYIYVPIPKELEHVEMH